MYCLAGRLNHSFGYVEYAARSFESHTAYIGQQILTYAMLDNAGMAVRSPASILETRHTERIIMKVLVYLSSRGGPSIV